LEALTDLDRLIERRASREPDPDELEPTYAESVRRFNARRQNQYRWEWVRYFDRMARNHARLAEEHAARAEALMEPGRG
jgi:hypothetical protein